MTRISRLNDGFTADFILADKWISYQLIPLNCHNGMHEDCYYAKVQLIYEIAISAKGVKYATKRLLGS